MLRYDGGSSLLMLISRPGKWKIHGPKHSRNFKIEIRQVYEHFWLTEETAWYQLQCRSQPRSQGLSYHTVPELAQGVGKMRDTRNEIGWDVARSKHARWVNKGEQGRGWCGVRYEIILYDNMVERRETRLEGDFVRDSLGRVKGLCNGLHVCLLFSFKIWHPG